MVNIMNNHCQYQKIIDILGKTRSNVPLNQYATAVSHANIHFLLIQA